MAKKSEKKKQAIIDNISEYTDVAEKHILDLELETLEKLDKLYKKISKIIQDAPELEGKKGKKRAGRPPKTEDEPKVKKGKKSKKKDDDDEDEGMSNSDIKAKLKEYGIKPTKAKEDNLELLKDVESKIKKLAKKNTPKQLVKMAAEQDIELKPDGRIKDKGKQAHKLAVQMMEAGFKMKGSKKKKK